MEISEGSFFGRVGFQGATLLSQPRKRMKMADQKGKRNCTRYDLEAIITWSYFNTTNFFNAKLVNYSESGLCFESESGIKPGAGIFIRLEKLLPNPAGIKLHQGFRTVTLGEARWCREAGDVGSRKYNIGIRYYEPYY